MADFSGSRFTRRSALGLAAAAPILALAGLPATAATAARPAGGRQRLIDTIGVQVHLKDTGSAYHDWPRVRSCLQYLGLRHLRSAAPRRDTLGYVLMGRAAADGYLFTFTMRHDRPYSDEIADLETFARSYPGSIVGIEGPNEIDHNPVTFNGRTDKASDARTNPVAALCYQAALHDSIGASPLLRKIPLIAFSDFVQAQQRASFSNTHIYPRNGAKLSDQLPAMHRKLDPVGRPIIITETGFHTLPSARPFPGTDEATQARLIRDAIRSAPGAGVTRTFIYQLLDHYPPDASMETHFGLFRYDYSAKPSATALREVNLGL